MKNVVILLLALSSALFAQVNIIDVDVKLNKKIFMSYEHIYATVTVKNNGGQNIRLHNNQVGNWLDFDILRNGKTEVNMAKKFIFAQAVIGPGQSKARTVALTQMYPLTTQGNYTVRAKVNTDANAGIALSRPAHFDVLNGVMIYQRQTGVAGDRKKLVEYRIRSLNKPQGTELYFQNYDPKKRRVLATYSLGEYLNVNKPQFQIDKEGKFHILFQVNAKVFRHLQIADSGKILKQELYKLGAKGIPRLWQINQKGEIVVRNAIPFDAVADAKKRAAIHNISQRPPFVY